MTEAANYITCPVGHKVFVIWSPELQRFGFTCDDAGSIHCGLCPFMELLR